MPSYKHTQPGGENKGRPTGEGKSKAAGKPVDPNQTRAEHEELKKKHTDGPDKAAGKNTTTNNPNRNTNKPDLDNNKYN
ncbi:hypothetical protein C8N40_101289 [Pontibacter mucosus]|uniref:Uncharacterized protein n=1 Tax=Pontibacter mucosus TaxID=1649266 RepID=A0A2T5YT19_9BACT|nr:hypothetical protein [Pontibacter mucosus]PTX22465.1 hypothetical protein C8N40_101289 [Pontibacter mucosus]